MIDMIKKLSVSCLTFLFPNVTQTEAAYFSRKVGGGSAFLFYFLSSGKSVWFFISVIFYTQLPPFQDFSVFTILVSLFTVRTAGQPTLLSKNVLKALVQFFHYRLCFLIA